jgi:predicted nucleic acid-binding protein
VSAPVLVADASALVEVLRNTEVGARVSGAMRGAVLAAPAHVDAEVLSALGRLVRARSATASEVDRALERMVDLPMRRYPLPPLLRRAWGLRGNIALADGLYVACAEGLGAKLVTLDGRLARSAPVPVELVT